MFRKVVGGVLFSHIIVQISPGFAGGHSLEETFAREREFVERLKHILEAEEDPRFDFFENPLLEDDLKRRLKLEPERLFRSGQARDDFMTRRFESGAHALSHEFLRPLNKLLDDLRALPPGAHMAPAIEWYANFRQQLIAGTYEERSRLLLPKAHLFLEGQVPWRFSQTLALQLLNKHEHGVFLESLNPEHGTHHVMSCPPPEVSQNLPAFYFKNCEGTNFVNVGKEAATYGMSQLLFGRGIAPSLLGVIKLNVMDLHEESPDPQLRGLQERVQRHLGISVADYLAHHPEDTRLIDDLPPQHFLVQIAKAIPGRHLRDHFDALDQGVALPFVNYGEMVTLSLLTNPHDWKGNNLIASSQEDSLELWGIDNDEAFGPPVLERPDHRHKIGVKNVLYAFPQMDGAVEGTLRTHFLQFSPEALLLSWVSYLQERERRWEALHERGVFEERHWEGARLPLRFWEGLPEALYRKMRRLKQLLGDNPQLTYSQLFQHLEPLLFHLYRSPARPGDLHTVSAYEAWLYGAQGPIIIEEILWIDGRELADYQTTHGALLRAAQEGEEVLDEGTLTLEAFTDRAHQQLMQRWDREEDALRDRITPFAPSDEEALLRGIGERPGILARSDLQNIWLRGSQKMDARLLEDSAKRYNWQHTNRWTFVDLSESVLLDHNLLRVLAEHCPQLETLIIEQCSNLKKIVLDPGFFSYDRCLLFSKLKALYARQIPKLRTIILESPFLETFRLDNTPNLKEMILHASYLETLLLNAHPVLNSLMLNTPALKNLDLSHNPSLLVSESREHYSSGGRWGNPSTKHIKRDIRYSQLQKLNIEGSHGFREAALKELIEINPDLQELKISKEQICMLNRPGTKLLHLIYDSLLEMARGSNGD